MATITTKDQTEIFYNDWGTGQPVVFSHGWPLSADAFEDQMFFLSQHGHRCIAHDRRGPGRSSQPWAGNDLDTYADDLARTCQTARSGEGNPCRSLNRWRRGCSLHRPLRKWPRRQGGVDWGHSSDHGEIRLEPRRDADRGLRSVAFGGAGGPRAILEGSQHALLRLQSPRRQNL